MNRSWLCCLVALSGCSVPAPPAAPPAAPGIATAPQAPPKPATQPAPAKASEAAAPHAPELLPKPEAATADAAATAPKTPARPASRPTPTPKPMPAPKSMAAAKPAPEPRAPTDAKPATAPAPAAAAPLDLKALERRLKETDAIGVLTKLSLKNQVDDLVRRFRAYHDGQRPPTLNELRPTFELLLMKVLALLQDKDTALARDINASRDAIWSLLTDRNKLAQLA